MPAGTATVPDTARYQRVAAHPNVAMKVSGLAEAFFKEKRSVVLTSATLSSGSSPQFVTALEMRALTKLAGEKRRLAFLAEGRTQG